MILRTVLLCTLFCLGFLSLSQSCNGFGLPLKSLAEVAKQAVAALGLDAVDVAREPEPSSAIPDTTLPLRAVEEDSAGIIDALGTAIVDAKTANTEVQPDLLEHGKEQRSPVPDAAATSALSESASESETDDENETEAEKKDKKSWSWDPNGYMLFCFSQGRFGNQVDYLLGALSVAKRTNRTLILSPFITYTRQGVHFVKYTDLFSLPALEAFHRVITLDDFLNVLAPKYWPPQERVGYCVKWNEDQKGCEFRKGNPSTAFWDHYNIHFVRSSFLKHYGDSPPASEAPVLATFGPPSSFPVVEGDRYIQKFIEWNADVESRGIRWIRQNLRRPILAMHLRNGPDWENACYKGPHSAVQTESYMASPQCGYTRQKGKKVKKKICLPRPNEVVRSIIRAEKYFNQPFGSIFVGTDSDDYQKELGQALNYQNNSLPAVVRYKPDDPFMDLYIFTVVDFFLGNCVSSFSAFAVRNRHYQRRLPSAFFGFKTWNQHNSYL